MKKLLSIFLSLLMITCIFAACSDKADQSNQAEQQSAGGDTQSPPHTHAFGEWTVSVEPNCTAQGEERRVCSCGEIETRTVDINGRHSFTDGICKFCNQSKDSFRLGDMALKYENEYGKLYFNEKDGTVAYYNAASGDIIFTNPTLDEADVTDKYTAEELMSHVIFDYTRNGSSYSASSYSNGILAGKDINVTPISNGIQLNYYMTGSDVLLVPKIIEATAFEEKILKPLEENIGESAEAQFELKRLKAYYNKIDYLGALESGDTDLAERIAEAYPVVKEKQINIYIYTGIAYKEFENTEKIITQYCPNYTHEELEKDHKFVEYAEENYAEFRTALTFTVGPNGLTVDFAERGVNEDTFLFDVPESGIDCNSVFEITKVEILPYLKMQNSDCVTVLCFEK